MKKSEIKANDPLKKKVTAASNHKKSSYKGKTPGQIMRKHILDKNDIITDEDFEHLNISTDITNDSSHVPLELPVKKDHPKDEEKDHTVITPWDVIKE